MSAVFKLPAKPGAEPIRVHAKAQPVDVFTSRGEFVHRLEVGEAAQFKPSWLLRLFGITRWVAA